MLENLRKNVDEIDEELVELLMRRADVSRKIGVIKAKAGLPILDAEREIAVIQKLNHKAVDENELSALVNIYRTILKESRAVQANILVGEKAAK